MAENHEIHIPLEQWAKNLVDHALTEHTARCPLVDRVQKLEVRMVTAIAFMVGSGLLGGVSGYLASLATG